MGLNLSVILRESARQHPDRTAIVLGAASLSYRELEARARAFAAALGRIGIRRGQHMAVMLPNVPEFTVVYFGAHLAGVPVVPLNVLFTPDEIAYHLEDSEAVALVVWSSLLGPAQTGFDRVPGCRTLVVAGAMDAGGSSASEAGTVYALPQLLDEAESSGAAATFDPADTMPDDTAVILYTSGTTGRAKGAELTHFNLFYNAETVSRCILGREGPPRVALGALPLFHSFGQTVIQNTTLLDGGTVILLPRFDAASALAAMAEHRVSFFAGVPTMYFALLSHAQAASFDLSSLRLCMSGGAPMPMEVLREFDARYGIPVYEGYGLSETSPVATSNVPGRPRKPGSIGPSLWGVELCLMDDQDRLVEATGERGEICIRGLNVMKGYWRRPEATAEACRGGWFHTGDIAHRDDDGYYFIVDRKKDMILRGGFNVYPREVEEVLYAHPAVAEAAVIGVPDRELGEEVKAVVALKAGAACTAEELIAYCREHVAAFKYPRHVEFVPALPKGPTGKILKRTLRRD